MLVLSTTCIATFNFYIKKQRLGKKREKITHHSVEHLFFMMILVGLYWKAAFNSDRKLHGAKKNQVLAVWLG